LSFINFDVIGFGDIDCLDGPMYDVVIVLLIQTFYNYEPKRINKN